MNPPQPQPEHPQQKQPQQQHTQEWIYAVLNQNLKVLERLLIAQPGLLNAPLFDNERTALMQSVVRGLDKGCSWLINHGAEVDVRERGGSTALYLAVVWGRRTMVAELLQEEGKGADPRLSTNQGMTPLMAAAYKGNVEIMSMLLHDGRSNINAQAVHDQTALHWSCFHGHAGTTKILVWAGANVMLTTEWNTTPLQEARSNARHACIALMEVAEQEPQRSHLLHKLRHVADAIHAVHKAFRESRGEPWEERRRKCLAIAPSWLRARVEQAWRVERRGGGGGRKGEGGGEEKGGEGSCRSGAAATASVEGLLSCLPFVFIGTKMLFKEDEEGDGAEYSSNIDPKAPSAADQFSCISRKRTRKLDLIGEGGGDGKEEVGLAGIVLEHVIHGGVAPELFVELLDYVRMKWDSSELRF